jgi:crossover junction endodeoxyribonuclease RuvC
LTRIIGLDPGLRITGWGIIEIEGNQLHYIAHGTATSNNANPLAQRLDQIYNGLRQALDLYQPHEAAVEETFVNTNSVSTLKLGMARGVVMVTPAQKGLPVYEYSANHIKKSVVGVGHASKEQVMHMVRMLLPNCGTLTADGADALAVAICHAHHHQTRTRWNEKTAS